MSVWAPRAAEPETMPLVAIAQPGVPHDRDLEASVIGAVLLSEQVLPVLVADERLAPAVFHTGWHREIWTAMLSLHGDGEPVDLLTVRQRLRDRGASDEQIDRVEMFAVAVPNLGNVRAYARRLVELARWRAVKVAGVELAAAADSLDEARRDRAETMLATSTRQSSVQIGPEQLRELLWQYVENGDGITALPTPFNGLEHALGGFRPGETTLLGGWTSRGKSVIVDMILAFLGRLGHRVHLYINEMTARLRGLRVLASEAQVPLSRLTSRLSMTAQDHAAVAETLAKGMPFGITEVAGWTAADIARDIRLRGWDLAAVDILHLIEHREERDLAEISQQLTTAARVSGTHLIATVHLNEERAKQAKLPPPVLRDIRGSGMLKNDADNVMFIHRDDETDDRGVTTVSDVGSLYLSKCRNGALGGTPLIFDGPRVTFREERP